MSTNEDIAKAYVALGVQIKKLQDERDEALGQVAALVQNRRHEQECRVQGTSMMRKEEILEILREHFLAAGIALLDAKIQKLPGCYYWTLTVMREDEDPLIFRPTSMAFDKPTAVRIANNVRRKVLSYGI